MGVRAPLLHLRRKGGGGISNLQIIESLCAMLDEAQKIIREQAALLDMHGIHTDGGALEQSRAALLSEIEQGGWG